MELKQERDLSVDKATVKFKGHSRYETAHADEAAIKFAEDLLEDGIYSCAFERADSKELVTNNCNRSSIQGKERQSFAEKQCGCNSVERQKK
ncbi:unnamed protein product [Pocillopora meandrina]|uniref:Uncharacterized protein n=1 Tax=Pocillopora meandrina TaxID=46732 RepID=A0AAU9WJF7_9CNID|nr:unnamed protein product [Pocillopora meandrina]